MTDALPPFVVVRTDKLSLRQLPSSAAYRLNEVARGQPLFVRCREGQPLYFGPWVGVLDGRTGRAGWVHGRFVSRASGGCPPPTALPPTVRLRPVATQRNIIANVRFGPSIGALVVGKVRPGARAWTDGRWVERNGHRWMTVMLENGVTGWTRSDLLAARLMAAGFVSAQTQQTDALVDIEVASYGPAVVHAELDPSLRAAVGVTYRPRGSSADLQLMVASQLSHGFGASLLAMTDPPTAVQLGDDGNITVQVELYQGLRLSPTLLEDDQAAMANSLLENDGILARHVEEVYGPEAALVLRAAFLMTPVPEEMADVAFVLAQDPAVRAQVAVLAAQGQSLALVLGSVGSTKARQRLAPLALATKDLAGRIAGSNVSVEQLHRMASASIERAGDGAGRLLVRLRSSRRDDAQFAGASTAVRGATEQTRAQARELMAWAARRGQDASSGGSRGAASQLQSRSEQARDASQRLLQGASARSAAMGEAARNRSAEAAERARAEALRLQAEAAQRAEATRIAAQQAADRARDAATAARNNAVDRLKSIRLPKCCG